MVSPREKSATRSTQNAPAGAPPTAAAECASTRRKSEHIEIVLGGAVSAHDVTTGFERYRLEHCALPEIDLDTVDLSTMFLGRRMRAPFIVSSMTGGPRHAQRINHAVAEAAGQCGVGFAVGSQRIALEGKASAGFSRELRALAGSVPILANFGAAQLKGWNGLDMAERALDMIDADALILHLNPLQEAVQAGGDRDWSGLLRCVEPLARGLSRPLVVKEVGSGIGAPLARRLVEAGVAIIDVAGAGGTSWAAVEARRAPTSRDRAIAEAFRDWGIPTAVAIAEVRRSCPSVTLIASGGIRNGVDAAKSIRLGADVVGQAAATLPAALEGVEGLTEHISVFVEQLRIACFCTGSRDLRALRRAPMARTDVEAAWPS